MYQEDGPHASAPAESAIARAEQVADIEEPASPVESESAGILAKAGWAAALGGAALASKYAEYKGVDHGMGVPERWGVDSAAHPLIGYMGAWAAEAVGTRRHSSEKIKAGVAWLGATAVNFTAEGLQSVTVAASQYVAFWSSSNRMETGRDYMGALTGFAVYLWQARRRR